YLLGHAGWRTSYDQRRRLSSPERSGIDTHRLVDQVLQRDPEVVLDATPVLDEDAVRVWRVRENRVEACLQRLPRGQMSSGRQSEAPAEAVAFADDQVRNGPTQASEELEALRGRAISPVPVGQERRRVVPQIVTQALPGHSVTIWQPHHD